MTLDQSLQNVPRRAMKAELSLEDLLQQILVEQDMSLIMLEVTERSSVENYGEVTHKFSG